jgi:hypothetical protein
MFCPKCKTENTADDIDCFHCGAELDPLPVYQPPSNVLFPPNPTAITAYYLGIFAMIPLIGIGLGIPAFFLGLKGIRYANEHPEARGKAHAWSGVIMGALFGWGQLAGLAAWFVLSRLH